MPQSSDPATFLELVRDYVVPAGGPLGVAIGWFVGRRRSAADARKIEKEADILVSDAMTRQFQALIGGYELRISDLTAEVHSLREEVKNLRIALDSSQGRVIDARR